MYLTFEEYRAMGGTLDETAFLNAERRARYLINSQAAGQTGSRIAKLSNLPEAVKDCTLGLITFMSANSANEKQVSSESQSQGGASESRSYVTRSDDDITAECENIIFDYLFGGGMGELLYRGVCDDEH